MVVILSFCSKCNVLQHQTWRSSVLQHTYQHDTRDEVVFASQGHLFELTSELAGVGLGGDNKFAKTELKASYHRKLLRDLVCVKNSYKRSPNHGEMYLLDVREFRTWRWSWERGMEPLSTPALVLFPSPTDSSSIMQRSSLSLFAVIPKRRSDQPTQVGVGDHELNA